jgi:pimeloyl-ACP methyl ester carboxylesterase
VKPFKQMKFDQLPESPRVPHLWAQTQGYDTVVQTASMGSVRIHTRTFGSGPPLLLVHGLMTASYSWRYQLERLGRHFTLHMPDLPGAGASDCPDVPYTPEALVECLATWMRSAGLVGCPVVGNSLGGYLMLRLALAYPDVPGRLVNLHSPGIPIPRLFALRHALQVPGAESILNRLVSRDPERWVHRNVHYYDETLKSREEAGVWAEPLRTTEGRRAFFLWLRDSLNPYAMQQFVRELSDRKAAGLGFPIPLLLVYAKTDPIVPPTVGERLSALLPGTQMVWLPDASHFAHVDNPDAFRDVVLPFLSDLQA